MDFVGDANQTSAVDVVLFVREIVETYPQLRDVVMPKLLQTFPTIQADMKEKSLFPKAVVIAMTILCCIYLPMSAASWALLGDRSA